MVFTQFHTLPVTAQDAYPSAGYAELDDLEYLHISDKPLECVFGQSNIRTGPGCRMHPDIIVPMRGDPSVLADTCSECVQEPNLLQIGAHNPFMALRLRLYSSDAHPPKWPEYLSLSFGDSVESAMSFREPTLQNSAGSFTARNTRLSLQPHNPILVPLPLDALYIERALRGFLNGCRPLAINQVHTFILDATSTYSVVERWGDLLTHLRDVETIILYGIPSFHSPELMNLAKVLGRGGYPCRRLRTVRVPDAQDAVPQAAISVLNTTLVHRRYHGQGIPLIGWTN